MALSAISVVGGCVYYVYLWGSHKYRTSLLLLYWTLSHSGITLHNGEDILQILFPTLHVCQRIQSNYQRAKACAKKKKKGNRHCHPVWSASRVYSCRAVWSTYSWRPRNCLCLVAFFILLFLNVQMYNNSKSPVRYTWEKKSECDIIEVVPHSGNLGKAFPSLAPCTIISRLITGCHDKRKTATWWDQCVFMLSSVG